VEGVILEPREIARRYVSSWFALDLVSSLPVDYIIIKWTGCLPPNLGRPSRFYSCWPDGLELSLRDFIRHLTSSTERFGSLLKTYLFARYQRVLRTSRLHHHHVYRLCVSGPGQLSTSRLHHHADRVSWMLSCQPSSACRTAFPRPLRPSRFYSC